MIPFFKFTRLVKSVSTQASGIMFYIFLRRATFQQNKLTTLSLLISIGVNINCNLFLFTSFLK